MYALRAVILVLVFKLWWAILFSDTVGTNFCNRKRQLVQIYLLNLLACWVESIFRSDIYLFTASYFSRFFHFSSHSSLLLFLSLHSKRPWSSSLLFSNRSCLVLFLGESVSLILNTYPIRLSCGCCMVFAVSTICNAPLYTIFDFLSYPFLLYT